MSDKIGVNLNRFRELIDNSGVSRQVIADFIGCDVSTVTKHYNGDRNITVDYVIKYAEYFNVSSDYLLGISDTPTTNKDIQFICDYIGVNEKAVESLHKFAEMKFSGVLSYESESSELLSSFISKRYLFDIEFLIDRYMTELKKLKNLYEKLYLNLKQNQGKDYICYEKIENCKNIMDLCKFKLQELNKDFLRTYEKGLNEEVDCILEKINNEYQLIDEETDRLFLKIFGNYKEGENNVNNP